MSGNEYRLRLSGALIGAVMSMFSAGIAHAQSQFGIVVGMITDSTGASIEGVAVHATNQDSKLGFSTSTGASGDYVIGGLLPGLYTIEVQKSGFQSQKISGVIVDAGVSARADVSMSPGSVQQSVSVTASATPLSTESGTVVAEISPVFLHAPTFIQATQMVGDVILPYMPGQFYLGGRAVSAYGSRSYERRETVDGAVFGISNTQNSRMPRGTINDLQGVSLIADAEHQTSNSTEMFTAKGTNDFHGSVWNELQNSALNQLPFYALHGTPKPGVPAVGLGFIVGGPARLPKLYNGRNKTFFFATFQKYWQPIPYAYSGTAANDAMRSGDFSGLNKAIIDPQTGQPFQNNKIPASRLSSIAQGIYNKYFPSIPGAFSSPDFPVATTATNPFWDFFVRGDHQIGSKDLLSVSYLHNHLQNLSVPGATTGGTTSGPTTTGIATVTTHTNFFNVSENHVFSARFLNEANVGAIIGVDNFTTASNDGASLLTQMGLPTTPSAPSGVKGGPTINITGTSSLSFGGQSSSSPSIWTYRDNLTVGLGPSTLKVGFELIRRNTGSVSYSNLFGTYGFSGMFTGSPFADYILGLPSSTSRALPPGPLNTHQYQLGFYGSDLFRVAKKLTIDAGLRAQYNRPPIETHGKYYNFDVKTGHVVVPSQNSMSLLNPGLSPAILANIVTAGAAGFPDHLVSNLWNISPRVGVAYQLARNTVFRSGFGIYGVLLAPGAPTGGVFTPGVQNFTNANVCSGGTCSPQFTLSNPFPTSTAQVVSGLSISGTKPGLRSPETYQWQASIEQRLSNSMIARATYAGSHSSQLVYQRNVDLPQASTTPFTRSRLVYPQWFSVNYADSGGNQSFNALDIELNRHVATGVTVDADYGWSKCVTDDDEGGLIVYGGTGALGATIEDPYNRSRDKGNCEEIPRNFFRSTFVLNSPFGAGQKWLSQVSGVGGGLVNEVLGGWTISGMFLSRSGHYFTPYITGVTSPNTGQTLIRPDRICSGVAHPQTDILVFDPSCFVAPPNGRYGNAGTGILNGLGAWEFDNGLYKYFEFARNEAFPKLRVGMNSINMLGHPAKDIDDISALIVNAPGTVARANDSIYTNGATANLGEWRHIYFELRLEW